ncbi:hypothetical protein L345_16432, partial [Ophiophagus hannah]
MSLSSFKNWGQAIGPKQEFGLTGVSVVGWLVGWLVWMDGWMDGQMDLLSVFPNVQLSQSLFKTQSLGQMVKLECAVSGVEVGDWYWGWSRKCQGKGLEWLGGIKSINGGGEAYYNPCFNNQIVITKDIAKNEFYLELRSVTIGDSA